MPDRIMTALDSMREELITLQRELVARPALGPDNGGEGEKDKAAFLVDYLTRCGITDIRELNAPDDRVPCGYRPNIAALVPGSDTGRTLWIISHTDVVPSGDRSLWHTDPFVLDVQGDTLIGRGVEDNHGGIVPSVLLGRALMEQQIVPPVNLGILLVADEETTSTYGLDYLVREHGEMFGKEDLFLVPDFGAPDGSMIEVAEKSILWVKVSVQGKQCHASAPHLGINSLVAASAFIVRIQELRERFAAKDSLFHPEYSTFEPTRKDANVPNVNTVPGLDVFYIDCRVLPDYPLAEVKEAIDELGKDIAGEYGVTVDYEITQEAQAAQSTPVDSEIVVRLSAAIEAVYGIPARPAGIGGGTVAAFLRRQGHAVAVWASCPNNAHQPNESTHISTQLGDAKVMASLLFAT